MVMRTVRLALNHLIACAEAKTWQICLEAPVFRLEA